MKKRLIVLAVAVTVVSAAYGQTAQFGTFNKPFSADSPWNIRPIGPVLDTYVPPLSPPANNAPAVTSGIYSTAAFEGKAEHPAMVVYPLVSQSSGIWDPDARENYASVTIPHWPPELVPAAGGDGHADIIDTTTGRIYSFWQLKYDSGQWRAKQYAWSELNGKGWPDPSHVYQGARAVGVPTIGGVIRINEVNDGDEIYRHALAMSMSKEVLGHTPTYVYPATSADNYASTNHTGQIPEGALMMLPADYVSQTTNPALKKVIDTLKVYGARVIDENDGTPFVIYIENGAPVSFYSSDNQSANNAVYAELERVRQSLRQVTTAYSFVDGNGNPTTTYESSPTANLLSMRGPWALTSGAQLGKFNTFSQSLEFPAAPAQVVQSNGNGTGISGGSVANGGVTWARPVPGATYRLTAYGTGGASISIQTYSGGTSVGQTNYITDGQSRTFTWPATGGWAVVWARSAAGQAGTIRATMIKE